MSGYTVIAGVTRTLGTVLKNAMPGVTVEYDKSPADTIPDSQPLVHLYLFRVERSPFFENGDWLRPSPTSLHEPPIGLNLLYLITPHGNGQIQIQITLGEVIKVFHEQPVIPPADYDPALVGATEELRVIPRQLALEELTELWRAFEQRSYRLGVVYEASVALIDSAVSRTVVPVEERRIDVRPRR